MRDSKEIKSLMHTEIENMIYKTVNMLIDKRFNEFLKLNSNDHINYSNDQILAKIAKVLITYGLNNI
ncbi:hypothetical protein [Candidatus Cyrtobacter comes]|uniref:hypothetical protein n=1 Tax=Candidatus Cyrtobacter comes TaxID=675776 RepID=UPI002ACDDF74|nr:hypothetical protein [Candidatus Cyrtobacter comes]